MDDLITIKQAAEALELTPKAVLLLINKGVLPAQTFGARTKLIKRADLELARNRPKPGRRWPAKKKTKGPKK